jgi:ribosomal protein L29
MTLEQRAVLKRTDQPLPKWNDETGVAALVGEYMAKQGAIAERFGEYAIETRRDPPRRGGDPDDAFVHFIWEEEVAVDAAQRGELAALIELLRGPHRDWLQPDTVELMIEFMTGKRNPQTGRRRGEGAGRSKMTPEEKEAKNPLRNAAAEFDTIKRLLRKHYPSERYSKIRERALELAAERASVEPEQLENYLGRARDVRRKRAQPFLAKHRLGKTDL